MSEEEEKIQSEFIDDRDDRSTVYGLPDQSRLKFNKSMIWVPLVIGLSVATGILTTRGIQRLTKGVSQKTSSTSSTSSTPRTMAKATSATSSSSSAPSSSTPSEASVNTKKLQYFSGIFK